MQRAMNLHTSSRYTALYFYRVLCYKLQVQATYSFLHVARMALISDRSVALGFVLCMAGCGNVLADRAQGE